MSIVAILKCGGTPEVEAEKYIKELLMQSSAAGKLCLTLAADFVNEIFKAIGFPCNITVAQLQAGEGFNWPATWRSYIFQYNTIFFSAFERFLVQTCKTVQEEEEAFIAAQSMEELAVQSPLEWFLQLLAIWCNASENLIQMERTMPVKYFEEPFARISFPLFLGMHEIRKKHGDEFPFLDTICQRFFHSALQGLFYKQCHRPIATALLSLVEADFGCCPSFSDDCLVFFYEALSVEQKRNSYANIYKCLMRMLHSLEACVDEQVYRKLLNFLIRSRMVKVYYSTLKLEKTKGVLLAILQFVQVLQSRLLDLDCFPQTFIESILANVLHSDKAISMLAAELYIAMASRKLNNNDLLLKHILEFYYSRMTSPESLTSYVGALWINFPYMQSLKVYVEIINNVNMDIPMLCFVAHFITACYKEMLKHLEKYQQQIVYMLQNLPNLCKQLENQSAKGILLQIFTNTDLHLLQNSCSNTNVLLNFEDYVMYEFEHCTNASYSYILNLFTQFSRSVEYTKNFYKLEKCGVSIYMQYAEIESTLKRLETEAKLPKPELLCRYSDVLQKLNALLKMNYNILDFTEEILQTLSVRLIGKQQFASFTDISTPLLDVYAIELMVSCCMKLAADVHLTTGQRKRIATRVLQLEGYLLACLYKLDVSSYMHLLRNKTHFNGLIALYCAFAPDSSICGLKLQLRPYHVLVQTLILNCLQKNTSTAKQKLAGDAPLEVHPQRIYEYQKLMFKKFTKLHVCKHIDIPSNVAWKLSVHYGLPGHKFNEDLATFMQTLAVHHLKIYTHILAVSVSNLYNEQSGFKENTILTAIRAHKAFIDRLPHALSPAFVNASVVLQVLHILQQKLLKVPPKSGGNRLAALKHLNQFTMNLNLNHSNVLPDILTQTKALQNHILNSAEQIRLSDYLYTLQKYSPNTSENNSNKEL